MNKLKNYVNVFFLSTAFSIITLTYLGYAYNSKCKINIPYYNLTPILVPLLYGIFGIINYYFITNYGSQYSFVIGALLGLLLSIIGRFYLHLPTSIFDFTLKTEYKVHIYALLMYAIIFQYIITPATIYLV